MGENKTKHPDPEKPNAHKGRLDANTGANNTTLSYLRTMKCGDRVGQVSCFSGDINDYLNKNHPDKAIPGADGNRHDPDKPLWNEDESWNRDQPGYLKVAESLDQLEREIENAKKVAESDCADEKSCCKTITIKPNCLPGGSPDFARISTKSERGRALCNTTYTLDCKTGNWK
jgi:hypothetical protein